MAFSDLVVTSPYPITDVAGTISVAASPNQSAWTLVVAPPTTAEFQRVGHSLAALAVAILGGLVARHFAARTERDAAG